MSTKILIAGGTGFIGRKLSDHLKNKGHEVSILSRQSIQWGDIPVLKWDPHKSTIDQVALESDIIINLAGAGIADKRWTHSRKSLILESRVKPIEFLFEQFRDSGLRKFISASAIGYYGADRGDELLDESSSGTKDFISSVVQDWESAAITFDNSGIPVSTIRIGIVLGEKGALAKMAGPVRWGVGSPLGSGRQLISWIHIDDLCRIFEMAIETDKLGGIYNAVAPNPVTNYEITKILARTLHRPLFLPNVPGFALRIILGELADVVLGGANVSPKKLQDAGFTFTYETAETAIRSIYSA